MKSKTEYLTFNTQREAMILFRSAVMQRVETNTEVDVNVDGWKLANIASKNIGSRLYDDK